MDSIIPTVRFAKTFKDLVDDKADILVKQHDALQLSDIIPDEGIDYVFTDPPYGGSIQYLELAYLPCVFLSRSKLFPGLSLDFDAEVTINPEKKFDHYHTMMTAAFRRIWAAMKPGAYMTLTFHSTSIQVWNSIILAAIIPGFTVEKIIYQQPAKKPAKGQLAPHGSAVGDYYIRLKKSAPKGDAMPKPEQEEYERVVIESARKIIAERGEPTSMTIIHNGIIPALDNAGMLPGGLTEIMDVMKKHEGEEFVLVDVKDEAGKAIGQKWWFKDPISISGLKLIPLNERIEKSVLSILKRRVIVTFDDVLAEILIRYPNALTPENQNINEVLEHYAQQVGRKWRLKPLVNARESEHSKIIYILAEIGKKLGYEIYIGRKEQSDIFDGKKLSSIMSKAALRLPDLPKKEINRVINIDVIWHRDKTPRYIFEVENTTGITEALLRGSFLPPDVRKYIVIPDERDRLLKRALEHPILENLYSSDKWETIYYDRLIKYFEEMKGAIKLEEFEELAGKSPVGQTDALSLF